MEQLASLVDISSLTGWMDQRDLGAGPIEALTVLTGGTQNLLVRFCRDGRTYVLRRPPRHPRSNADETMRREARVLAALAGSEVPHPTLIAACGDPGILGAAFYLMEEVKGFNASLGLPAPHAQDRDMRHDMGLALADGAAALGRIDIEAAGIADLGRVDAFLERQPGRWKKQLSSYADYAGWPGPSALPDVDAIAAWLAERCPSRFRPGILHGDYHMANVMFRPDGPELAAIVDWELATIGDPLLDLGWMLATWPDAAGRQMGDITDIQPWDGFATRTELIDRYAMGSDRDLSAIDWYVVLACYKLGILLEGTHARAAAGQAEPAMGERLHRKAISLFEQAHHHIHH